MIEETIEVSIRASIERVWALWIDPGRMAQWQMGVELVAAADGPVDRAGTTLVFQVAGAQVTATAHVIRAEPEQLHEILVRAFRTKTTMTARFLPDPHGTRLRVRYGGTTNFGPLSRLVEWTSRGGFRGGARKEIEAFKAMVERPEAVAEAGAWYSLDDGSDRYRLAQVLATDPAAVHLRLLPGTYARRPAGVQAAPSQLPDLSDPAAFSPLDPSLRGSVRTIQRGQRLLLLDGGLGVEHLPIAGGCFTDALPERVGIGSVAPELLAAVESWRAAGGPVVGRDPGVRPTPLVALAGTDGRFGAAKILAVRGGRVRIRTYVESWPERPIHLDPWSLRAGSLLALSRAAFGSASPTFVKLTLVAPDEVAEAARADA